jgi:hypothetical protein
MELTIIVYNILPKKVLDTLAEGNRPVKQEIRGWVLVGIFVLKGYLFANGGKHCYFSDSLNLLCIS